MPKKNKKKKKRSNSNSFPFLGNNSKAFPGLGNNSKSLLGLGSKSKSVNLLGNKSSKPFPFLGGDSKVSFLDNKKVMPRKSDLNLSYKNTKKKYNLSPWGDYDFDGSPNKHDCSPLNPLRDKKKIVLRLPKRKFAQDIIDETLAETPRVERVQKIKKRAKAFLSGTSSGRPLRKIVLKKTKKGLVIRKFEGPTKLVKGAVSLAGVPAGFETKKKKGDSVHIGRGRPKGSFKFSIPGKGPVPIHVFKKYMTKKRALERLKGELPEPQLAAQQEQLVQESEIQEDFGEEDFEEAPQVQAPQAQVQPVPAQPASQQQQVPAQQVVRQPVQQIQQQTGVPRTNLDFSRSTVLTPQGGNILNAPNIQRGELKDVGGKQLIDLGNRPVTNPTGDVFTQIDPITGRPILQRRISERFLTNEPL